MSPFVKPFLGNMRNKQSFYNKLISYSAKSVLKLLYYFNMVKTVTQGFSLIFDLKSNIKKALNNDVQDFTYL